ncbi:MAG TPA: PIN domain-containing protein [Nitrospiraceae bacterium]|jgi:PIN domain nuclease of toxin-antitoxin system|nr:PIN domain-containing protein [Nitrospiraceae bacterium]
MTHSQIYVLDTHTLVWFLKRDRAIGQRALKIMLSSQSRLVVPIYLIEEIRLKSLNDNPKHRNQRIGLPPATVLRILTMTQNIKVFPRSPAVAFEEEKLYQAVMLRRQNLQKQDIPICATALAIKRALTGSAEVFLITTDAVIRQWGKIPIIWN